DVHQVFGGLSLQRTIKLPVSLHVGREWLLKLRVGNRLPVDDRDRGRLGGGLAASSYAQIEHAADESNDDGDDDPFHLLTQSREKHGRSRPPQYRFVRSGTHALSI